MRRTARLGAFLDTSWTVLDTLGAASLNSFGPGVPKLGWSGWGFCNFVLGLGSASTLAQLGGVFIKASGEFSRVLDICCG